MRGQNQNQNFMSMIQALFGSRSGGSVGSNTNKGNSFNSVQTGAGKNALPLSEMEKAQKEKVKKLKKKKRKKALNQVDTKAPVLSSLNNKTPSSNLGTLKIGLNLNSNQQGGKKPKSDAKAGLNLYR